MNIYLEKDLLGEKKLGLPKCKKCTWRIFSPVSQFSKALWKWSTKGNRLSHLLDSSNLTAIQNLTREWWGKNKASIYLNKSSFFSCCSQYFLNTFRDKDLINRIYQKRLQIKHMLLKRNGQVNLLCNENNTGCFINTN